MDERQVELIAHHAVLAQLACIGPRQVACKARRRILQRVADEAMQAVRPDGPLTASQVAQKAAEGLMPLSDDVLVCAFERQATKAPDTQEVSAARDDVMRTQQ